MDSTLRTELEKISFTEVLLITVALPDGTIRWTDGGTVVWEGQVYTARDATYGAILGMEPIEDGVDTQATVCALTLAPKDSTAFNALIAPGVQGSPVTVHLGAVNRSTGALIGEPDLIVRLELDQPRIAAGGAQMVFDCITEEARMLEPNEERRLTDVFHQLAWPGELGLSNVTAVKQHRYWRADRPNNAIS